MSLKILRGLSGLRIIYQKLWKIKLKMRLYIPVVSIIPIKVVFIKVQLIIM